MFKCPLYEMLSAKKTETKARSEFDCSNCRDVRTCLGPVAVDA